MKFTRKKIIFYIVVGVLMIVILGEVKDLFCRRDSSASGLSMMVKSGQARYPADSLHQEFSYNLSAGPIPLGQFILKVEEERDAAGRDIYLLRGSIRPWNFLNKIAGGQIGLDLISHIDRQSLLPYFYEQTPPRAIKKGKKGRVIEYHHNALFMVRKNQELDIEEDTKDPLATIFWLMRLDYDNQKIMKSTLNINPRVYLVIGKVTEQKTLSVTNQNFDIVRLNAKILKVNQAYQVLRVNPVEVYLMKKGDGYLPLMFTLEVMHLKIHLRLK